MANEIAKLEFRNTEEYGALVEECRSIIVVGVFNFQIEKIVMYGRLGEKIANDPKFQKYVKGNPAVLDILAEDIGMSRSELYRAIQFYEKFRIVSPDSENFNKFEEGNNISWTKIKARYLPAIKYESCKHALEEYKCWRCKKCKKIFSFNPKNVGKGDSLSFERRVSIDRKG